MYRKQLLIIQSPVSSVYQGSFDQSVSWELVILFLVLWSKQTCSLLSGFLLSNKEERQYYKRALQVNLSALPDR